MYHLFVYLCRVILLFEIQSQQEKKIESSFRFSVLLRCGFDDGFSASVDMEPTETCNYHTFSDSDCVAFLNNPRVNEFMKIRSCVDLFVKITSRYA